MERTGKAKNVNGTRMFGLDDPDIQSMIECHESSLTCATYVHAALRAVKTSKKRVPITIAAAAKNASSTKSSPKFTLPSSWTKIGTTGQSFISPSGTKKFRSLIKVQRYVNGTAESQEWEPVPQNTVGGKQDPPKCQKTACIQCENPKKHVAHTCERGGTGPSGMYASSTASTASTSSTSSSSTTAFGSVPPASHALIGTRFKAKDRQPDVTFYHCTICGRLAQQGSHACNMQQPVPSVQGYFDVMKKSGMFDE